MDASRTASVPHFKLTKPESSGRRSPNPNHVCSSREQRNRRNNMNNQSSHSSNLDYGVTRRRFIGTAAGGSAALLTGGLTSLLKRSASAAGFDFVEATIPQLQAAMASGALTIIECRTFDRCE